MTATSDQKWCTACKARHERSAFSRDASRFGVSKTAIRYAQTGRNWQEFPR
jgi:hypothetical protein